MLTLYMPRPYVFSSVTLSQAGIVSKRLNGIGSSWFLV